ncbi:MAG: hypothetical protein ACYTBZ_15395, partial [Planctomycetota bacterium]
ASARNVGELLSILYLPAGPSGTEQRYTLVYMTAFEWGAAASWVDVLDVSAVEDASSNLPEDIDQAFTYGIGLIYGKLDDISDDTKRFRRARDSLLRVLQSPEQPERLRWASGIIAGWISTERFYEHEEAIEYFSSAEVIAQPGSHEQMVSQYAQADVLMHHGKGEEMKSLLSNLIARFIIFRKTEVYERANRVLVELN